MSDINVERIPFSPLIYKVIYGRFDHHANLTVFTLDETFIGLNDAIARAESLRKELPDVTWIRVEDSKEKSYFVIGPVRTMILDDGRWKEFIRNETPDETEEDKEVEESDKVVVSSGLKDDYCNFDIELFDIGDEDRPVLRLLQKNPGNDGPDVIDIRPAYVGDLLIELLRRYNLYRRKEDPNYRDRILTIEKMTEDERLMRFKSDMTVNLGKIGMDLTKVMMYMNEWK